MTQIFRIHAQITSYITIAKAMYLFPQTPILPSLWLSYILWISFWYPHANSFLSLSTRKPVLRKAFSKSITVLNEICTSIVELIILHIINFYTWNLILPLDCELLERTDCILFILVALCSFVMFMHTVGTEHLLAYVD